MNDRPIERRTVLKAGALAASATGVGSLEAFSLPPEGPRALTRSQYALLDELAEILIPADDQSGGARAAGVAAYIDATLAEEFDRELKGAFLRGLDQVDALARTTFGAGFTTLSPGDRESVVAMMAKGEANAQSDLDRFFVELKRRTIRGYYTSRIGIHDDMQYKGNTMQEQYSGIDVSR